MSALLQLDLFTLQVFLVKLTTTSMFSTMWSLLPILPPSETDKIFSGQFVKIRSRVLPFVWVGMRTICSRFSSTAASRTARPRVEDVIFCQFMSGRLKSPTIIVCFSRFFMMLHRLSVFAFPAPGGLYISIMVSGSPFV